jgi:hypothetical protein
MECPVPNLMPAKKIAKKVEVKDMATLSRKTLYHLRVGFGATKGQMANV